MPKETPADEVEDFIAAWNRGDGIVALAARFHIGSEQVYARARLLRDRFPGRVRKRASGSHPSVTFLDAESIVA